ncbi:MAG TPA: hypothetical protein PLF88_14095, partial [Opitutaceae bacterium]|nr:hypothetical protein [Opitutaceae bacterium]
MAEKVAFGEGGRTGPENENDYEKENDGRISPIQGKIHATGKAIFPADHADGRGLQIPIHGIRAIRG